MSTLNLLGTNFCVQNREAFGSTSSGPTFVFRIERHLVHTGYINVYTEPPQDQLLCSEQRGIWFIQVILMSKLNLLRTNFCVQNREAFGSYRLY